MIKQNVNFILILSILLLLLTSYKLQVMEKQRFSQNWKCGIKGLIKHSCLQYLICSKALLKPRIISYQMNVIHLIQEILHLDQRNDVDRGTAIFRTPDSQQFKIAMIPVVYFFVLIQKSNKKNQDSRKNAKNLQVCLK